MTKGPNRILLDQYLDSAADGWIKGAGTNWKQRAKDLKTLSDALAKAAAAGGAAHRRADPHRSRAACGDGGVGHLAGHQVRPAARRR